MTLKKPLEKKWTITQRFETKVSYMRSGIHSGIDYACPGGTELLACFDGIIEKTENVLINAGYGRAIWIRSAADPTLVALYGHTSQLLAVKGAQVKAGEIIALSGRSGFVLGKTGYHLHFGLQKNGTWIDPLPLFDQAQTVPITPEGIDVSDEIKVPVRDADPEPKYESYTIKKGDTMYGIAKRTLSDAEKWKDLAYWNRDIIENPRKIYPGTVIRIPTALKKKS
jgi:LysM repeat protein